MSARKTSMNKPTARKPRALTIWDGAKYFDAEFTNVERSALREKVMDTCGYGEDSRLRRRNYLGFEHDIERPAEDQIWPAFCAAGFDYDRNRGKLHDYALIHICRQLEIDYKRFAQNVPKLPIDGFIAMAKKAFPEFKRPRNNIERKIQEHKLHGLWCDWHDLECQRTGCNCDSHWLCHDRFAQRDFEGIIDEIAKHNETRPKLVVVKRSAKRRQPAQGKAGIEGPSLQLVYSQDRLCQRSQRKARRRLG